MTRLSQWLKQIRRAPAVPVEPGGELSDVELNAVAAGGGSSSGGFGGSGGGTLCGADWPPPPRMK